ncbi:MAG: hypothetical protein M1832_006446 [Thelocarpon impressellum]|nr:MAG: hypothetical protein M1832_006446 [Thelocarpon impressellum]
MVSYGISYEVRSSLDMAYEDPVLRTGSSSAPSPVLSYQPRMSISSIVNPPQSSGLDVHCLPTHLYEGSQMPMADSEYHWPGVCVAPECCVEASNYQASPQLICPLSYDEPPADPFQRHAAETTADIYHFAPDPSFSAGHSNRPRSYADHFDMSQQPDLASSSQGYPPSSYLMDPIKHQPYMTFHNQPDCGDDVLAVRERGALDQVDLGHPYGTQAIDPPSPASTPSPPQGERAEDPTKPSDGRAGKIDEGEVVRVPNEEETDAEENEPYAKLIRRALLTAPGYRMILKEIYDWFVINTDKAKDPSQKGWQNSIRHNLSMNAAFKKVELEPSADDGKKGFAWQLQPEAVTGGVKSTTRYRKPGPNKKVRKSEAPAIQRQASGRKGGQAAKRGKAAKSRREKAAAAASPSQRQPEVGQVAAEQACLPPTPFYRGPSTPDSTALHGLNYPNYLHRSATVPSPQARSEQYMYAYDDVVGVASSGNEEPLFCDGSETGDDCITPNF